MLDLRTTLLLTVVIVAVAIVVLIQLARRNSGGTSSAGTRLRSIAMQRDDYSIQIGMPLGSPIEWETVLDVTDSELTLKNGSVVSYSMLIVCL